MADSPVSSDPNIIPPVESASVLTDRPVSTILADSPIEPKTPLADPATDYTAPVKDDLSGVDSAQTDSPVATESASIASPPSTAPADTSTEAPAKVDPPPIPAESPSQPPADPVSVAPAPVEPSIPSIPPDPSVPSSPPEATSGGSIQDYLTPDLPFQVQPSEPSIASDAAISQEPETVPQSAEIKQEPPQGTQDAPLADSGTPISPKTSFGDLVSDQPSPVSPPVSPQAPQSPQAPKSSFADLMGTPPTGDPTITIEPIEPPKRNYTVFSHLTPISLISPISHIHLISPNNHRSQSRLFLQASAGTPNEEEETPGSPCKNHCPCCSEGKSFQQRRS